MKKLLILCALALACLGFAEPTYLGLYMQGSKIGYSRYDSHPDTLDGKKVSRSDSKTVMSAGLLGQSMSISIDGSTWTNASGRPVKMLFLMTSAGRTQKVVARFNAKTAEIDVFNSGAKSHKSLPIPNDAKIVDDPLELLLEGGMTAGAHRSFYILDPMTVSFMKNEVALVGPREFSLKGKKTKGTLVRIIDPRATTDVYLSGKGDLLKVEAPMGIEMIPETKAVALEFGDSGYKPSADLAFATSLKPDKKIDDPEALTGLTVRVSGRDLSRLPSDGFQTVTKDGESWKVDVHPPQIAAANATAIATARAEKPDWVKPSLYIPSDSATFKSLAAKIVKGETAVVPAALAIKDYVHGAMRPNAGIGVLRDASEVLKTKEGVCRDYAILTATLMRAAGIPARLCSGIVSWNGDFYYHAWVEIWDGSQWLGIDSTQAPAQISAAHVKLADGNVDDAFAFTFLDKVKIEILDVRRG